VGLGVALGGLPIKLLPVNPMTDQERPRACCAFDRSRAFEQPLADIGGSRLFAVPTELKTG